jgi:hypothetical protein
VPHHTIRRGLVTAGIAAAATAGTLCGFGVRMGTPARPFNAVAILLLGDRAVGIWGFDGTVTMTGVLLHLLVVTGWSILFAALAGSLRGLRLLGAAVLVAAVAFGVDAWLFSRMLGAGIGDVLAPGQRVALYLVLAVSLAMGMRLAHSWLWNESASTDG